MAFGVGSKAFLRKGGRPATTRESTGAKVWRIESAGDDRKPTGVFHDGIKSSQMWNPKDGDFPGETNDSGARKEKPVTTTAKSKKSKPQLFHGEAAKQKKCCVPILWKVESRLKTMERCQIWKHLNKDLSMLNMGITTFRPD